MDTSDVISLVFSTISVVLSTIIFFWETKRDKDINEINLESEYFNDIYKDYLIKEIPNSRKYIRITRGGKVDDYIGLCNTLKNMRNSSLYYYYQDKKFYDDLTNKLNEIEVFLINTQNKTYIGEEQTAFYNDLQNKLTELYSLVKNKYVNN